MDSSTAKIGAEKPKVVASANGSRITAPKLRIMPISPVIPRNTCALGRLVPSLATPPLIIAHTSRIGSAAACRQNNSSIR